MALIQILLPDLVLKPLLVKKSLESTYPRPEGVALRPIHGFATAISKAIFRRSRLTLTTPKGRGFRHWIEFLRHLVDPQILFRSIGEANQHIIGSR
jgi:hypothetical protein